MHRRAFLSRGAGAGLAGLGVGVLGGGLGGSRGASTGHARTLEPAHYAGTGRGAAQVVWSVDTDEPAVALTFDDGPHPRLTPEVLEVLAHHDVRATFFLIGAAAERHPSLVRRIADEGHEVGSHSWSHAAMAHVGRERARDEVLRGAAALERLTGTVPRWFRSPRGMLNGPILRAAADLGQDVAMWSARLPANPLERATSELTDHLLGALEPGAIYCLHDGTSGREDEPALEERRRHELSCLPELITTGGDQGFSFVTLSHLADPNR